MGNVLKRIVFFFAILLVGCATTHQPDVPRGFYHRKVTGNSYVVGFSGSRGNDGERAWNFALLLAAEVGRDLGYSSFTIREYSAGAVATVPTPTGSAGFEITVAYSTDPPNGRHPGVFLIDEVIRRVNAIYRITY